MFTLWPGFDAFIKKHGPSIQGVVYSWVNYYERKVQADTGYHVQPLTTLPFSNTLTLPEADTSRCYSHKPNIRHPLFFQKYYPRRREWLTRSILESQSATIFTYIYQLNQGWNTSPASVPFFPCIYLNPQTKLLFSNSLSLNCGVSEFPYCHITKAAFKYLQIYFESCVTCGVFSHFFLHQCCPPVPQPRYLLTSSYVLQSWIFLAHTPNSITD